MSDWIPKSCSITGHSLSPPQNPSSPCSIPANRKGSCQKPEPPPMPCCWPQPLRHPAAPRAGRYLRAMAGAASNHDASSHHNFSEIFSMGAGENQFWEIATWLVTKLLSQYCRSIIYLKAEMIQQVLPLFADLNGKGAQDGTEIY